MSCRYKLGQAPSIDPLPCSSWLQMKHSTVGGQTRGTWYVSLTLNLDIDGLNTPSKVIHTLRDVLKSTVDGTALTTDRVE